MIHHIAVTTRANRKIYKAVFARLDLPKIELVGARGMARFCRTSGLDG